MPHPLFSAHCMCGQSSDESLLDLLDTNVSTFTNKQVQIVKQRICSNIHYIGSLGKLRIS